MKATIYHNPRCGTSRKVLERLQAAGAEVAVINYLRDPPSRAELARVLERAGLTPAEVLRRKEPEAEALIGADADVILDAMCADPFLIERPLVETERGVRLCRPAERVEELL